MKPFISVLVGVLFLVSASPALAHDLIPQALQNYIVANPNASAEDIRVFVSRQDPEYATQFESGEEILTRVRAEDVGFFHNAYDFIKIGIAHILSGADHVLFVLTLLLVFVGLREILKITTTFTIAHSITLMLSATGIIFVNPRVTEPLIAFSIAYVAITSVFLTQYSFFSNARSRIGGVFFFGLFHGLGFAGLLQEVRIPGDTFLASLFAFNVGIEVGQLLVIAIALPVIYFCRHKAWYPLAVKIFAAVIAVLALVWMIERIFF